MKTIFKKFFIVSEFQSRPSASTSPSKARASRRGKGYLDALWRLDTFLVKKRVHYVILILIVISFFVFNQTEAAEPYFSSLAKEYSVGQEFILDLYVSSTEQAINAVQALVIFPEDKLEIKSLDKSNSIINLWIQEPFFSNIAGEINFEGIILSPAGFIGPKGKILTVNFHVKEPGLAEIFFSSGSILANDGKGTNIISNLGKMTLSLKDETQEVKQEIKEQEIEEEDVEKITPPPPFDLIAPEITQEELKEKELEQIKIQEPEKGVIKINFWKLILIVLITFILSFIVFTTLLFFYIKLYQKNKNAK